MALSGFQKEVLRVIARDLDSQGVLCAPDPAGVAAGRLALHAGSLGGAWPRVVADNGL